MLLPISAAALELSLEENKGESGTVGYVDIDRVFKEYSGTLNAREEFLDEIKKKEGAINQRKHGVFVLKADIAKLRQEREFALTLPSLFATQERMSAAANQAGSTPSTAKTDVSTGPAVFAQVSTQAASERQAVNSSSETAAAVPVAVKPAPRTFMPANLPGMEMETPGVSTVTANYFKFSVSTAVPEIDAALTAKEADLKEKEDALKLYQRQVERELLEYESHRSEVLLGYIYVALKELAVREGVSVIMDKRNILFGHSAVDLTDKLLKKLEEPQ